MSQRVKIAVAVTVALLGTFALGSVAPSLRTGPGPLSKRLRKSKTEKPLPEGIKRIYVDGVDGKLEVLTNEKSEDGHPEDAPLLMIHGGMGSARCYDKWAVYFASKGRKVYSLSIRGHGLSNRPDNFNSLTNADFCKDIASVVVYITESHPTSPAPVLIGHSAGGGLSQYTVSTLKPNTFSGVILLAPYPNTGGAPVYLEWIKFDPLFFPRFFWHGCDNMSPLSSPALVKRAFFSDGYDEGELKDFFNQMNPEETPGWPATMTNKFTDHEPVKMNAGGRVHIISASHDRLMTPPIMKKFVERYGCSSNVVEGSGHHMMFDNQWQVAARYVEAKLEEWNL
ncbi:alpha beta hydrolase fold protein [Moniliophthora roreri]|uniref:Serine aminopeptidase S33 domain-containing protein n=1 Tax=Moniliophthora roreri TaxID=221103 RepID=A0A0W0G386_MONRR|nr:alpha beta hydrolase fold protein [Moniliophthora roreri]